MKDTLKNAAGLLMFLIAMTFFMSGCVEHRYYHTYHHHSSGYYHRHNMPPPPGVELDIHN